MKIFTLLTTLIFTLTFSFSQELTIKYNISMESSDPAVQSQLAMMQGSTYTMYLKGTQSRIESNMGGGLMVTTNITDIEKKQGLVLMNGMMGKIAAPFNLDSLDKLKDAKKDGEDADFDIELVDETKEILGHTCKKAIIYGENDMEFVYWYTEDFQPSEEILGSMIKKGLPGMPLEFSIDRPEMKMKYTAIDLKEKVEKPKQKFDLTIPEGYSEKSFDEIEKMIGQ